MNLSQIIKKLCKDLKITTAELSRRTGQSPQNLGRKLKKETLSYNEFLEMLNALGVGYEYVLKLPGDKTAEYSEDVKSREKIAVLEAQIELEKKNVELLLSLGREVRTGLYTISGSSDIALKHIDDPARIKECLEKIKRAESQIIEILDDGYQTYSRETRRPEPAETEQKRVDPEIVKGRRILLVDDNEMNREITEDMLEDNGFVVETAEDGAAAVDAVSKAAPGYFDCVLMDIQMPKVDGLEAARKIRALPNRVRANVPIIAMTANAFEEDRRKSFDAGMDAHLSKPIDAMKLIQVIVRYL